MGRYAWLTLFIVLLLVGGVITLFFIQNGARTTQLSLDLGFAAWQLQAPMSIPALLGATALGSFLLGALPMWIRGMAAKRRVRVLERQAALSSDRTERPW
jgi:uncharacterized integral membrane protein